MGRSGKSTGKNYPPKGKVDEGVFRTFERHSQVGVLSRHASEVTGILMLHELEADLSEEILTS
jgi:hypothetical protein